MSFQPYSKYKHSGIEWLGELPEHWEVKRFKQVFLERDERSTYGSETLLSVSAYTGVSPRAEIIDEGDHLSRAESLVGYKNCYPDDLVMNIMLAWNRGLGFSVHEGIVSPAYSVFQVIDESHPPFLNYLVRSDEYTLYFKAFSTGVIDSRLRLYPDVFGRLGVALPSLAEQTTIASFLDQEIDKIDALVAEQERLILVLKEKRQAVISRAVTKGLNPNVPIRNSGIESLGEVPAHWDFWKLKYVTTSIIDAEHKTAEYYDNGQYLVVRTSNVKSGRLVLENAKYTDFETYTKWTNRGVPEAGDIMFTREAPAGEACIVPENMQVCLGQRMVLFKINRLLANVEFVLWCLYYGPASVYISMLSQGSTVSHFNMGDIVNIPLFLPPLSEQDTLATFLNQEVRKNDGLVNEAEHAIELLKERRGALISAAVTGKIDVRGLVREEVTK